MLTKTRSTRKIESPPRQIEIPDGAKYKPWVDGLIEKALTRTAIKSEDVSIDPESYEEVKALVDHMQGSCLDIPPE